MTNVEHNMIIEETDFEQNTTIEEETHFESDMTIEENDVERDTNIEEETNEEHHPFDYNQSLTSPEKSKNFIFFYDIWVTSAGKNYLLVRNSLNIYGIFRTVLFRPKIRKESHFMSDQQNNF